MGFRVGVDSLPGYRSPIAMLGTPVSTCSRTDVPRSALRAAPVTWAAADLRRQNEPLVFAVGWRSRPLGRVASLGQDGRVGRCRPVQVRRLDRASLRSILCASRICPSKALMVAVALSGFSAPSLRPRAVWPRSPLLWRPDWRRTTPRSASCGSSTPADRLRRAIVSSANWSTDRARSLIASSDLLNQFDVAVVQHEYGLYGGTDGDEVLEILGGLHVPSIVIAHTILDQPDATSTVRAERGCSSGGPGGRHDRGGPGPTVRRLRRGRFQSDHHRPRCCHPCSHVSCPTGRVGPSY